MKRTLVRLLMASLGLIGAVSCVHQQQDRLAGRDGALPGSSLEARLPWSSTSVEDLVAQFAEALENSDEERLNELAVTYEEFDAIVWPELDASRPETNLDSEFVWSQYDMRSKAYRARLLSRLGGQRYTVESVEFTGTPKHYDGFVILDDPVLTLVTADGSREKKLLFGAIIEHDGHYKIYGYSTD